MNLEELKVQRAKLDEQIRAAEEADKYPWSAGPWKIADYGTTIDDIFGKEVVSKASNRSERDANSRLIAAAPELYQMLELVVSEHKEGAEALNLKIRDDSTIGQAEQLLARVREG